MATVEAGARLAHLAARLAEEGNPNLRGDALVAAVLAGAGAEAAADAGPDQPGRVPRR